MSDNPSNKADILHLFKLSKAIHNRWIAGNDPEAALNELIHVLRQLLSLISWDAGLHGKHLLWLGECLVYRYASTKERQDLDDAIESLEEGFKLVPWDQLPQRNLLGSLVDLLRERRLMTGSMTDLDQEIEVRQKLLNATELDDPLRPDQLMGLAGTLDERFLQTRTDSDLHDAKKAGREALQKAPADHPYRKNWCGIFGRMLVRNYILKKDDTFLEEAIQFLEEALELGTPGHYDRERIEHLNNLAFCLVHRSSESPTDNDLERAIALCREVSAVTSEEDSSRLACKHQLAVALRLRHSRSGAKADLYEAIHLGNDVLLGDRETYPEWARLTSVMDHELGRELEQTPRSLQTRFDPVSEEVSEPDISFKDYPLMEEHFNSRLGRYMDDAPVDASDLDTLEEVIEFGRKAIILADGRHPNRFEWMEQLANGLSFKAFMTNDMRFLDEAIQILQGAIEDIPESHPDYSSVHHTLGSQFSHRYDRIGTASDQDECIRHMRIALDSLDKVDESATTYLINLGVNLGARYWRLRAMSDLEEAIEVTREAGRVTSPNPNLHHVVMNSLGLFLQDKYMRQNDMRDLDESIEASKAALEEARQFGFDLSKFIMNLACGLHLRFQARREIPDLEEAIALGRESITLAPENDRTLRATLLATHGEYLMLHYEITGSLESFEEALSWGGQSVALIPEDNRHVAMVLINHAKRLQCRFEPDLSRSFLDQNKTETEAAESTGKFFASDIHQDHDEALGLFMRALQHEKSPAFTRLTSAAPAISLCALIEDWQQAFHVAEVAIPLVFKLVSRPLTTSDKYEILQDVHDLSSDATAVALNAGMGSEVALNFLEEGRGLLARSLSDIRGEVPDLKDCRPDLAERYAHLCRELGSPTGDQGNVFSSVHSTIGHESQISDNIDRQLQANDELDILIAEIRRQPGFDDFLNVPTIDEMKQAAVYGPIVIINVSRYRCDAIVIQPDGIRLTPLPSLDYNVVGDKTKACYSGGFRTQTLEWLWDTISYPVLTALGMNQPPDDGEPLPHIWWIPTGPLVRFPLHAAGYHKEKSGYRTVMDRAVSSYSPSLQALVYGRRRKVTVPDEKALLVGMEHTPGHSKLPFVSIETEAVRETFKSMDLVVIEPKKEASDIKPLLQQCIIFHFAGHGAVDRLDPSKSHILLENKDHLTVSLMMEMNLHKHSPFLAYLSACGTGRVESQAASNESAHLINGFLVAGFRHVIGTLWDVNDEFSADMAQLVYTGLKDHGIADKSISIALHRATRVLRDRWLEEAPNSTAEREGTNHKGSTTSIVSALTKMKLGISRKNTLLAGNLFRDIIPCDDEDSEDRRPLLWIPFVHFGV